METKEAFPREKRSTQSVDIKMPWDSPGKSLPSCSKETEEIAGGFRRMQGLKIKYVE